MIIYKVTNLINGKVYVGATKQRLSDRVWDHKAKAFRHGSKSLFHTALRKHGWANFKWEIIDQASTVSELHDKERLHISGFKTFNSDKGYNSTSGGHKGTRISDKMKEGVSKFHKGRKHSEEENKAKSLRQMGAGNPFYGKSHSSETKTKISEVKKAQKIRYTEEEKEKFVHRGSDNGRALITEGIAREIKIHLRDGWRNCDIQRKFDISKSIVKAIKANKTWRHVKI